MIHYINFRQLIIHQSALSYAHRQLKTTELPIFPLRSPCLSLHLWQKALRDAGVNTQWSWSDDGKFVFPHFAKKSLFSTCHWFTYMLFCMLLCISVCFMKYYLPFFISMLIGFRKKYFWVPSVSFSPSDCSTCFRGSISLQ